MTARDGACYQPDAGGCDAPAALPERVRNHVHAMPDKGRP